MKIHFASSIFASILVVGLLTSCQDGPKTADGSSTTAGTSSDTASAPQDLGPSEAELLKRSVDDNMKDGMDALQKKEYDRAERVFLASLKQVEQMRGQEARHAAILNNLASVYEAKGMYSQAVPLLNRAQRLFIRAYGRFHQTVYTTLGNLGRVLGKANRPEEAASVYQTVVNLMEEGKQTASPQYKEMLTDCLEAHKRARAGLKAKKIEDKLKSLK